jgi:hypothetical protein
VLIAADVLPVPTCPVMSQPRQKSSSTHAKPPSRRMTDNDGRRMEVNAQ